MIGFLSVSEPDRRLLPSSGLKGPVPVLFCLMMFIMVIVAAAGLAIANLSAKVRTGLEHRYTIQMTNGGAPLSAVLAAARAAPGVERVAPVPEAELRRTLERWLGPSASQADLPLPTMVDVDLKPGADAPTVAAAIAKVAPAATFQAHRDTLRPILTGLRWLGWLSLSLVLMTGMAASAAVVLAARGALDSHRSTIDVMHGIGANDAQIARLFLRQIARDALSGGLLGALLAGGAVLLLASISASGSLLTGASPIGWLDLAVLASLPVLAALVATLVARRSLMAALEKRT